MAASPPTPDDPAERAVRERLSRRDPADWPFLLDELKAIAAATAPAFRDVCSGEDALGELALRTHERWLEDWLTHQSAPPLRLFLRDRLRDHLRELRRRHTRRAELLSSAAHDGPIVEVNGGPARKALFASPPPRPDEILDAVELEREVERSSADAGPLLALRAAGFDQSEIATRTGLSRPTVGRRLAAIAAVLAAITAAGLVWAYLSQRAPETPIAITPEPRSAETPPSTIGGPSPEAPEPDALETPEREHTPPAPIELRAPAPPTTSRRVTPVEPVLVDPTPAEPTTDGAIAQPPNGAPTVDDRARICLGDGDYACVIRLLGGGRAHTARQLALLAQAQRALTGVPSSCPTIARLIEQFPASPEAARYRAVHVAQCQDR